MRFSYNIVICDADHYIPLAQAAEEASYNALAIPDSVCYPKEASSKYANGSREFLEPAPFMDALIAVPGIHNWRQRVCKRRYRGAGGI